MEIIYSNLRGAEINPWRFHSNYFWPHNILSFLETKNDQYVCCFSCNLSMFVLHVQNLRIQACIIFFG